MVNLPTGKNEIADCKDCSESANGGINLFSGWKGQGGSIPVSESGQKTPKICKNFGALRAPNGTVNLARTARQKFKD